MKCRTGFLAVCALASAMALAAEDPRAGRQKAQLCMQCHGVDGYSRDENIPHLYGQPAKYIIEEMLDFQSGRRPDPVMTTLATQVRHRQDLEDIAAYFASLPRLVVAPSPTPLAPQGERLFRGERCSFCHADAGDEPYVPAAPVLRGQQRAYLVKAMRDIRAGARRGDHYGLMRQTFNRMSDQDLEALADYLHGR